jgi:hypothetical protein
MRTIIAATALALSAAPAIAQERPKTSWGAPDLQGYWTNASITKMSRPAGVTSLVLTPEQAKAIEDGDLNNRRLIADQKPTDQTLGAPAAGGLQNNGNYNAFWWDPGTKVAQVNGEYRSSWIVEPADGRIPYKNRAAPARPAAAAPAPARAAPVPQRQAAAPPTASASGTKPFVEPGPSYGNVGVGRQESARAYEGPESRSLGERCLIGFGNTGGPVMTNVLYNNMYQIVQSPKHVMILIEMNNDARIIPILASASEAAGAHRPSAIKPWLGDSVGWYEGDTLVVETKNVNPIQRGHIGPNGKLIERFTRAGKDEILYRFEVDDPDQFSQVWRGEMPFRTGQGGLWEYACHEGNYGLTGILEGARQKEKLGQALETTAESE